MSSSRARRGRGSSKNTQDIRPGSSASGTSQTQSHSQTFRMADSWSSVVKGQKDAANMSTQSTTTPPMMQSNVDEPVENWDFGMSSGRPQQASEPSPLALGARSFEDIVKMAAQFQKMSSELNPQPSTTGLMGNSLYCPPASVEPGGAQLGGPPMHDQYDDEDEDWDCAGNQSSKLTTPAPVTQYCDENDEYYTGDSLWDFGDSNRDGTDKPSSDPMQGVREVPPTTENCVKAASGDLDDILKANPLVNPSWLMKTLKGDWSREPHLDPSERRAVKGPLEVDKEWLQRVEEQWTTLKTKESRLHLTQLLRQCFNSVTNPYNTVLYLIEKSSDFTSGKTYSLAFSILKEFERWVQLNTSSASHAKCLDQWIMMRAFNLGTRGTMYMLELIVKAYKLRTMKETFLPCIHNYLHNRQFKEAAQCVTKLGLQQHFQIQDIVFPLILQDKVNLVENYVYRNHDLQLELLKLLDFLVDPSTEIGSILRKLDVPDIKRDKLVPKILSKLAVRLLKLYQIPQDVCPNIHNKRTTKALNFLIHKKYMEESLGGEQWDELIESAVNESPHLQEHLIEQLVTYCDVSEALRWARQYKIPEDRLPHQVIAAIIAAEAAENAASQNYDEGDWDDDYDDDDTTTTTTSSWSSSALSATTTVPQPVGSSLDQDGSDERSESRYHPLSLPQHAVVWINTRPGFYESVEHLTQEDSIVGIDGEWRPTFGQNSATRIALLQLALHDQVYLWDMLELKRCLQVQDWCYFAEQLFASDKVLKLGYGMDGDLQLLIRLVPAMRDALERTQRLVDLHSLHKQVLKLCPDMFDKDQDNTDDNVTLGSGSRSADEVKVIKQEERGLSDMVKQCLGKPLDKSQRVSDWERRPLRSKQIDYAALDAYVLLEVYEALSSKVKEHNIQVNLEPPAGHSVQPRKSKLQKRQQKVAERLANARPIDVKTLQATKQDSPEMAPRELRVVVDNMLQGLGKQLRSCGVDVVILNNGDEHERAAEIARQERRMVLTSGMPYQMLRSQVSAGRCFCVSPGKARDQLQEVLEHYNVKVTQNDIFSRCQVCNGDQYLFVEPEELHKAWKKKRSRPPMLQAAMEKRALAQGVGTSTTAGALWSSVHSAKDSPCYQTDADSAHSVDASNNFSLYKINMEYLCLEGGVPLQVDTIPEPVFKRVEMFFVCTTCGKVFWEGAHFERVCEQFSHVLEDGSQVEPPVGSQPAVSGDRETNSRNHSEDVDIVFDPSSDGFYQA